MPHEIRIPRLGWSMEEGVFVGWLKRPGEPVAVGEPLFELEGEKALQEIEAVDEGILQFGADSPRPGSTVKVGALMGYLLAVGEMAPTSLVDTGFNGDQPQQEQNVSRSPATGPAVRRRARELGVDLQHLPGTGKAGRITREDVELAVKPQLTEPQLTEIAPQPLASPRAKRIAAELGVDWTGLEGTGHAGRIREADVRAAQTSSHLNETPSLLGTKDDVMLISPRRKAIAERLRQSLERTIPVTLTAKMNATNLVALRQQFKSASTAAGLVPAYTDLVACLVSGVLQKHRQLAVRWSSDQRSLQGPGSDGIHLGIAVDTAQGLLVPVLRDVGRKTLLEVTAESQALIAQARGGQLLATQMEGGHFTLTNLGSFGIEAFTPIINYPEVAILGLGAICREPVVLADDTISVRDRMTLSLTFDHAALDGAAAAAFLRDLSLTLENPAAQLLSRERF